MVKFISFGSGSSGNCYYLNSNGYGLLIDAGVSVRLFKRFYKDYGLSFNEINALLITHEHYDHVKSVGAVSQNFKVPVYATTAVHAGIGRNYKVAKKVPENFREYLEHGETLELGPFRVTSFAVPHDSNDNSGYFIEIEDVRLTLVTDAGKATADIMRYVSMATHLVMEANYEDKLLDEGPYPPTLRKRIRSCSGHMSNHDAGSIIGRCAGEELKSVWLCHLSEENNRPEVALASVEKSVREQRGMYPYTFDMAVLNRKTPTGMFCLNGETHNQ